jgi:glycosyltransferase involved in cell wall biosynthesis
MNILHLDEQIGWRGGEQQASWLVQGLAAKGHQVWISGKPDGAFLKSSHGDAPLNRLPLPFWAEVDLYTCWRLAQVVYQEEIDIIHAHTSHTHTIACLTRTMARRASVVVSRRVSFPPKTDKFNQWKYRAPDALLAVSEKVAEVLRESGLSEEKVTRVYSAVDLARLEVPPASRKTLGVSDEATLLFSAGALVDHKDHATLLSAMPAIIAACPSVHLLIAGEGALRASLEQQMEELALAEHVTLLGHRTDVPALVQAADLYISSSWSEGLGTSVLEALACETPVVAAVAGGIPEMVLPGKTGYLVPNRDPQALAGAVVEALKHPKQSAKMSVAGRKLVEQRFTAPRMVESTLEVYLKLVARARTYDS